MHYSNVVFKQHCGPSSNLALVALVGKCVSIDVVFQVPFGEVSFATQLACMWPVVQMPVDMRCINCLVGEALTTVRTYSVRFFNMHHLYVGVFVAL